MMNTSRSEIAQSRACYQELTTGELLKYSKYGRQIELYGGENMKIEKSIDIAASPEKLWPLLFKKENLLRWHPNAQEFDFIGDQNSGVGARFYFPRFLARLFLS